MRPGRLPGSGRKQSRRCCRRGWVLAAVWLLAGTPAWTTYGTFVLTGPPGSGKTTILDVLRAKGFLVVEEAYTALHQQARTEGVLAGLLAAPAALHGLLGRRQRAREAALPAGTTVFLDRSLVDICYFGHLQGLPGPGGAAPEPPAPVYDLVFHLDPLPEDLFERTEVRAMTHVQAQAMNVRLADHYKRHGYRDRLVPVPFATPAQRAEFILHTIRERYRVADVVDAFTGFPAGRLNGLSPDGAAGTVPAFPCLCAPGPAPGGASALVR